MLKKKLINRNKSLVWKTKIWNTNLKMTHKITPELEKNEDEGCIRKEDEIVRVRSKWKR